MDDDEFQIILSQQQYTKNRENIKQLSQSLRQTELKLINLEIAMKKQRSSYEEEITYLTNYINNFICQFVSILGITDSNNISSKQSIINYSNNQNQSIYIKYYPILQKINKIKHYCVNNTMKTIKTLTIANKQMEILTNKMKQQIELLNKRCSTLTVDLKESLQITDILNTNNSKLSKQLQLNKQLLSAAKNKVTRLQHNIKYQQIAEENSQKNFLKQAELLDMIEYSKQDRIQSINQQITNYYIEMLNEFKSINICNNLSQAQLNTLLNNELEAVVNHIKLMTKSNTKNIYK